MFAQRSVLKSNCNFKASDQFLWLKVFFLKNISVLVWGLLPYAANNSRKTVKCTLRTRLLWMMVCAARHLSKTRYAVMRVII